MQQNHSHGELDLVVNDRPFKWPKQFITGAEVRQLGDIGPGPALFLVIPEPWEDELILDETRVDLARPGRERFISREKHERKIILTIETTRGKWENAEFNKHLTIAQLIDKVVSKFGFAKDGKYGLQIKGRDGELPKGETLEALHLKDHTVLSFVDLGNGAVR